MAVKQVENCIFCKICNNEAPASVLFSNDNYLVFSDIRPATSMHFLTIPKTHITNVTKLTIENVSIVKEMVDIARKVLVEKGADLNDSRFGFHWPPFTTVGHLHLHAISPASQMGMISRLMFKENSFWFVSPEYVINRLENLEHSAYTSSSL